MTFQFIRFSIHRPTIANSRNRDKNRLEIRALNYQILVPSLLAPSDNPSPVALVRGNFAKLDLQILVEPAGSGASTSIDRVNLSRH